MVCLIPFISFGENQRVTIEAYVTVRQNGNYLIGAAFEEGVYMSVSCACTPVGCKWNYVLDKAPLNVQNNATIGLTFTNVVITFE